MNTRDINEILKNKIETSDTISQFMEKCNNNFAAIVEWGGGPKGDDGSRGVQGVPTKPKVPIHVWREGIEYNSETESIDEGYIIDNWNEDLTDVKYQEGHLIMLENAHAYILKASNGNSFNLRPKFIVGLHSYNPDDVVNGLNGYVHLAYANSPDGTDGFITDQQLRGETIETEQIATFSLRKTASTTSINDDYDISNKSYMGVYSDNTENSSLNPARYTWMRVQGNIGLTGERGEKGDKGDGYTGHPYTIDLEGDMSTISIDVDRTRLYDESGDYCQCIAHAYYGDENVKLSISEITVNLPDEYKYSGNDIVFKSNENSKVGKIEKTQNGNDVAIKFIPDESFIFPKKTIIFSLHVETSVFDENDSNTYEFTRDTVWMVKGIMSTYELEILPQYRTIKLFEDGAYYPETLLVSVYKVEDAERTLFDFNQDSSFTLLYKNLNDNNWLVYPNGGVNTKNVSCLEFKVVKNWDNTIPETEWDVWDYEDVWVVADGKGTHYYHADLGSTESMMVLTTGEKINIGTEEEPKYCAELRNESGYSITFEPKFYDGTEELEIESVNIGSNSGDEYYLNGTFERTLKKETIDGVDKYTLSITSVPYGIELIPMSIDVRATCPVYDEFGQFVENDSKNDSVSFNVYISSLSNTYTLVPTVSTFNTSTGKDGDKIGCAVFKNNTLIDTKDLDKNGLKLMYVVHDGGTDPETAITYTEPLVYGDDDDVVEDEFTASDVAIEFILYYRNKEIVRSTVPLIKDGVDGRDGDSWQYIFCRSPKYPFSETGYVYPSSWTDQNSTDPNSELYFEPWYDDHKGVSSEFKYEYQAYRKWDKDNKCWGKYGDPTLYSNYSENGSGYSVILSNPVAIIPVGDDDWSVNENVDNQDDFTLVYLYNNMLDISAYSNVEISLPKDNTYVINGNFSIDEDANGVNKVVFKPVVNNSVFDFESDKQYKLPITISYSLGEDADNDGVEDKFVSTVNWILRPIKGLHDVEVFVDKRVVNTSISEKHTLKVGYYLISSNDTKKFIENHNTGNSKGYKIILTDDIEDLSSGAISDWQNAEYNFVTNKKNRNCYVVLVDSDGSTIIDYAVVTSVNDGKSAIHLELTQDYIAIPCSADGGSVHPDYDGGINSRMMLYNGDKLIEDYENITYSFKIDDTDVKNVPINSNGSFDIPVDVISGDTNVECIATYNGTPFSKTLFVDLEETPYELEINKSVLSRDVNVGKIIDKTIIVRVKYWMNGNWEYTSDGIVKANTTNGKENLSFGQASGTKCERTLSIENTALANNKSDTEVRISYYKNNSSTDELSYETIGIINNGKDGSAPSCVSVKILGYSLNENEKIEGGTWVALNKLGTLTPGQPIYILNEYTWDDGTKTKGVTVTMAGTQGPDGKSRVLFYLGSFDSRDGKTPTLEGNSVTGLLDDDRCDYYIDKTGQAWMRTGTANSAVGSSSGNSGDVNWKASTKVGFLQAGAITADMINTGSLVANSAFINSIQSIKITASQIDSGTITADKIATGVIPEGLDENDVTTIINATTIDGGKIKTGTITANQIKSGAITADKIKAGAITTDKIDVDNLSVKKLNTTGSGYKSNIVIENNQLNAYNGESLPSLTIRGNSFEKIIPGLNIKTLNTFSDSNSSKMTREQVVASFTFLKNQNHCEIIIGESAYYCACLQSTTKPLTSGTYKISGTLKYKLYEGSTLISTLVNKSVLYKIENGKDSNGNGPIGSAGNYNFFDGKTNPITIDEINYELGSMTKDTTYTVKAEIDIDWIRESGTGEKQMWELGFTKQLNIVTRYAIERTDIGQNGFRTAFDSSHFVEFSNYSGNSSIMMYSKNAGIRITDNDIFIKIGGTWYRLFNSSGNLKLTETTEQNVLSQYGKPSNSSSYSY